MGWFLGKTGNFSLLSQKNIAKKATKRVFINDVNQFFFRFFLFLIELVRGPNVYFKKLFRVVKFSCTNMNRGKMKNYRIISLILVWFIFIIQAVWTMITKTITEHLRENYKVEPKLNKFQLHSLTAKLLYTFQILNEKVS